MTSKSALPVRRFGTTDMRITHVGFGSWAVGGDWAVGWGSQDDSASIAAIRRAVACGVNWIDTAAIYGLGHSEEVVAAALAPIPASERPYVFTKCGAHSRPCGPQRAAEAGGRAGEHPPRARGVAAPARGRAGRSLSDALAGRGRNAARGLLADAARSEERGKSPRGRTFQRRREQLEAAEKLGHVDTLQPPFSAIRRGAAAAEIPWCETHRTGRDRL